MSSSDQSVTTTMQAATPQAATGTEQQPAHQAASMDFASILSKIQSLEKEKSDMRAQLEMAHVKLSKLQVRIPLFQWHMHDHR